MQFLVSGSIFQPTTLCQEGEKTSKCWDFFAFAGGGNRTRAACSALHNPLHHCLSALIVYGKKTLLFKFLGPRLLEARRPRPAEGHLREVRERASRRRALHDRRGLPRQVPQDLSGERLQQGLSQAPLRHP